jgi:hypothetical protein
MTAGPYRKHVTPDPAPKARWYDRPWLYRAWHDWAMRVAIVLTYAGLPFVTLRHKFGYGGYAAFAPTLLGILIGTGLIVEGILSLRLRKTRDPR